MKNILSLSLLLLLVACQQTPSTEKYSQEDLKQAVEKAVDQVTKENKDETEFIHTVFFWMNEEVSDKEIADFMEVGLRDLAKIPSIYKAYYGPPAGTPREVVDNSYDVALVCHFKSSADQDLYQDDPIHLAMIEKYKHLWKKVQVYDNLTSN